MALRILCAGCSPEEREAAESAVGKVLATQPGTWMVSLVKIGGQWSVTIDGPDASRRGLTLVAPAGRLQESIRQALGGTRPVPRSAPAPAVKAGPERRDRQQCGKCGRAFAVVYQAAPHELERTVQVACPHCWHVGHFAVGEEAALNKDYRAEKLD